MSDRRANLLRTMRREGFESVPLDFVFCDSQIDAFRKRFGHEDYQEYFGMSHREVHLPLLPRFSDGRELFPREDLPADAEFDEWGIARTSGSKLAYHMKRMHHPLRGARSAREIADYPFPDVDEAAPAELRDAVNDLHARDLASFGFMAMTIWETAWYLRSMEDLMVDMMLGDDKATVLLDRMTESARRRARIFAEAGVDILHLGDDIGSQSAPIMEVEMWRAWLKPRLAAVISDAREARPGILIHYHSCGYITPFIPDLIEIGVDILNPVQPECMEFDDIHAKFGDRLSFWGTIGTQRLLPFGSASEVEDTVRARLRTCGERGGIVIGPTHMVEPEVPWENLLAVGRAADGFTAESRRSPE